MAKTYSWEEIRSVLKKGLQKTEHILTYGTIGSCNIEHDIDTIITKKPSSPSSAFFREIHELFAVVDEYLQKKHNSRLIRTSRFGDEDEVKYIANSKKNDLVFQVMTYVSLEQIRIHWYPDVESNDEINKLLKDNYNCIFGNAGGLFRPDFNKHKNERLFIRLNDSDRINSHFPASFLIARMNVLFDFILRKRLNLNSLKATNERDVRTCK